MNLASKPADLRYAIDPALVRARVAAVPPLPQAATRVLALLRRESSGAEECAAAIATDPALTALTLRLANSAYYGMQGRVASVRDAIQLLGRRTLSGLVTTAAVSTQLGRIDRTSLDFMGFWRHALGVALAAQVLARECGHDDDVAFTAGLLHDLGRLVLAAHFAPQIAAAAERARAEDRPDVVFESSLLGTDHAQVGALLTVHWKFPAAVAAAIAGHHAPPQEGAASLTDIVHVADAMVHALDLNADPNEYVPEIQSASWQRLALAPQACLRCFDRTETGVAELCRSLGFEP